MKLRYFILAALPMRLKRLVMTRFLGWEIDPTAHISMALVKCDHVVLGPRARIGFGAVIQGLQSLHVGADSTIGGKSRIFGETLDSGQFPKFPDRVPSLRIGEHSDLLRVTFDCQDVVEIGKFTTFAGRESLILSHGIDVNLGEMTVAPVKIGDYCMIGARVTILMGVSIADRSVIGASSVVTKSLEKVETLYAGSPATAKRAIPSDAKYFSRKIGRAV